MSRTPIDDHFVHSPDLDIFSHRPHKSLILLYNAATATAVFQIWPQLVFFGGWATMVVCVNKFTSAEIKFPNTMITVLGVLLGLTLSYRTSSAYDRYWEGRRMWSQIILASRTWARTVWIHCPDSVESAASTPIDLVGKAKDEARGILEKKTIVRMAHAFSVAVKHYLRGEEGIRYEDLYDLANFIPSLDMPSGLPDPTEATNSAGLPRSSNHPISPIQTDPSSPDSNKYVGLNSIGQPIRPRLRPARNPPRYRFSEYWPIRSFVSKSCPNDRDGREAMREKMRSERGGRLGQNVPLEITMFMSSWISAMQRRKTVDVPTINTLLAALNQMSEALTSLERILTTPIPWSYNAHIWEVTWVYCLALPFQLYSSGFGWWTIPAVVVTTYIVVGFAAIGQEIENPFGYDRNDLNLDLFVRVVGEELDAITSRAFDEPITWVFSSENRVFGPFDPSADVWVNSDVGSIREKLARSGERRSSQVQCAQMLDADDIRGA